jgi:GT2 family glycosyltransferase
MRFVVGVLTHNAVSTLRLGLLEQTGSSLRRAFPENAVFLLDNGSVDGSAEVLEHLSFATGRVRYSSPGGNVSPGRGRNELLRIFAMQSAGGGCWGWAPEDVVVLSDDDILWEPLAAHVLSRFWSEAPDDLIILSCLLEPEWPWNTPREVIECGGVKALVRDSAPAAAWTFRLRDWDKIGPLKEVVDEEGEDFEACGRLCGQGFRVAQIDLATHIGEGYGQLGNDEARLISGRPLDKKKWGM